MSTILENPWLGALAILLGSILVGYLARALLIRRLAAVLARTDTPVDDLLLAAVRGHVPLWFLLLGLVLAAHVAPIAPHLADRALRIAAAALTLSLSLAAASYCSALLRRRAAAADRTVLSTSLSVNVIRGSIFMLGGLLVLANLGIAITPLLTALGVGSLAVALALQPTLTNFIAGVHISVARPFRVGDFVQLENGTQGFVEDIGWRATRVRELPNNIIIVPNSRMAEMILTNYAMPEPEQAALVQVGVAYGSDMQRVERVTCEVARDTLASVQGGVGSFEPFIRYHTFGDSSIDFTVILRVREFTDRYLVTHEFMKRLKARYDAEGIEIPFPQRMVHAPVRSGSRPGARDVSAAGGGSHG